MVSPLSLGHCLHRLGLYATGAVFALTASLTPLAAQIPPAPSEPRSVPTVPDANYPLGPGDRLHIEVLDEFEGEYQISVNGTLALPLIGNVSLRGKTVAQAQQLLLKQYLTYLRYPDVTVRLLATRPLEIAIYGEVSAPGTYLLAPEDSNRAPKLTQAIAQAGGVTRAADVRQVEIRRPQQPPQRVDLWQLLQGGQIEQDVALRDGDTIFIPTASAVNREEMRQLAAASFAAPADRAIEIAVVGEVTRPGTYAVGGEEAENQEPPTVTQALKAAGGITHASDVRKIQVRRLTRTGVPQTIEVNLWELLKTGDLSQDVILQAGDTVVIPKAALVSPEETRTLAEASFAPETINVNVVGEVESSGIVAVPPNTPLNQALLAAGGFNDEAKKSKVELVRLNPNGTVSQRTVEVDFTQGISEQNNPILHHNDVVVVKRSGVRNVTNALGVLAAPFLPFLRLFR